MKELGLILLGLILGIPFAYFVEFTAPWVRSYLQKGSLSLRERRLDILVSRYRSIRLIREKPLRVDYG
jgi:hypothetical protein